MRTFFGALILLASLSITDAAEIRMKDGSVVYGDVEDLVDGQDLVVDTEHMGDVTIEWDAVVAIRDADVVVVELFDGRRVTGRVTVDEGEMFIEGSDNLAIQPEDVFSFEDVKEGFWDAVDAYVDLGMNVVRGNNRVTQISTGTGVSYDAEHFETSIDATMILNEQTVGQDTRRRTLRGNYIHRLGNNWNAAGILQFESDDKQGLQNRTLLGGLIARRLVNQRRHRFELGAGLAVNSEDFVGTSVSNTLEGALGARYRLRSAFDFDATLLVLPSLESSNRVRAQFDSTASVDLIADLDVKLTFYDRYDSDPPVGNDKNDYGLTLGLSWSY